MKIKKKHLYITALVCVCITVVSFKYSSNYDDSNAVETKYVPSNTNIVTMTPELYIEMQLEEEKYIEELKIRKLKAAEEKGLDFISIDDNNSNIKIK